MFRRVLVILSLCLPGCQADVPVPNPGMGGASAPDGGIPGGLNPPSTFAQSSNPPPPPTAAEPVGPARIQYWIPDDLEVAAGLNLTLLAGAPQAVETGILEHFRPVLAMLDRLGIHAANIEEFWCGSTRSRGEVLVCVRVKQSLLAGPLGQALGRTGDTEHSELVGQTRVYHFSRIPGAAHAFAILNGKTLLIGSRTAVLKSLGDHQSGAVRVGIAALAQPGAFCWVSGAGDESAKKLSLKGLPTLPWLGDESATPRSLAVCLTRETLSAPAGNPVARPDQNPALRDSSANPGMQTGTAPPAIEVRTAWTFMSPQAASLMGDRLNGILQAIDDALQEAQKAASKKAVPGNPGSSTPGPGINGPGNAGPGQPGPGNPGPGNPGPGNPGPGVAGPGNPGPMPTGGMPTPGPATGPVTRQFTAVNSASDVRLVYRIPETDGATVVRLLGRVLTACGASALDDGLFSGSLTNLNAAIDAWQLSPQSIRLGMRKVSRHPWAATWSHYSWMTELLPHLGYEHVYNRFDFDHPWAAPFNLPYAATVVPAFLNPADSRTVWDGLGPPLGATHFVGMSGIEDGPNVTAADLPRSDPRAGIFGYDAVARQDQITDGTSQTILMLGSGEISAGWVAGGGATIRGAREPYFDRHTGFGSRGIEPRGVVVLLADGSARVISASVSPAVFRALCTIRGAERVDMQHLTLTPDQTKP